MAFKHGSKAAVYVNGRDLSAYLKSVSLSGSADTAEVTVLSKTSKDYIAGLRDATVTAEGFFDGSAGAVDVVFEAALGNSNKSEWTYWPQGEAAIGDAGYGVSCVHTTYKVDSPVDGVTSVSADAQSDVGVERVKSLHVLSAETAGGNSASLDNAAASTSGGAGYLQVTAITGTNVIVKVQHSTDNFVADTTDLITFTSVTAGGTSERVAVTGTIKRYLRASWAGTFTSATFSLAFSRA